jgi:hypothetical protein
VIGFSTQSVPLIKDGDPLLAGTSSALPAVVTSVTNSTIAPFNVPTFQEGSGSAAAERDGKRSRLQRVLPASRVWKFQRYGPPSLSIPPRSCRAQLFGKTFAATASE